MKSSKIFAKCSIDFQQVFAGNSLVLLPKRSCRKDSEIQFAINLGEDMQYLEYIKNEKIFRFMLFELRSSQTKEALRRKRQSPHKL